jgi:hypothetical protein
MNRAWLVLPLTACTVTLVGYPRDVGTGSDDASVDQRAPLPDRVAPPPDAPPMRRGCDGIDGGVVHPDSGACYYRVEDNVVIDAAAPSCGDAGALLATGVTRDLLGDSGVRVPPGVWYWVQSTSFGADASCATGGGTCCSVKAISGGYQTATSCPGNAHVICERP